MKGCEYCNVFKNKLNETNIPFHERDIDIHKEEYDMFVEAVDGSEFVPAFMIIEETDSGLVSEVFAPERDYNDLDEGYKIIKDRLILD